MKITKTVDIKKDGINFSHICDIDISRIKTLVQDLTEDQWLENSTRQNLPTKYHSKTQTYFLVGFPFDWTPHTPIEPKILRPDSELYLSVLPTIKFLEEYHGGKVGSVIIPKLLAGEMVYEHKDIGEYLGLVRRNHLAIVTNENVYFSVGGEVINMREGELWEINNNLHHGVENFSDQDRIHMIIDIIPEEYLS